MEMLTNEIVKKLAEFYEKPHTDSDIRDFCEENDVNMKEAYEFLAVLRVPPCCIGCCNVAFYPNMYPCHSCSRIPRKDYFGVEVQ